MTREMRCLVEQQMRLDDETTAHQLHVTMAFPCKDNSEMQDNLRLDISWQFILSAYKGC